MTLSKSSALILSSLSCDRVVAVITFLLKVVPLIVDNTIAYNPIRSVDIITMAMQSSIRVTPILVLYNLIIDIKNIKFYCYIKYNIEIPFTAYCLNQPTSSNVNIKNCNLPVFVKDYS